MKKVFETGKVVEAGKLYETGKVVEAGMNIMGRIKRAALLREEGLDGILVTIGLCVIALVLCAVMKESMSGFITTLTTSMTSKAQTMLSGGAIYPVIFGGI